MAKSASPKVVSLTERKRQPGLWRILHAMARGLGRRNAPPRRNPFEAAKPLPGVIGEGRKPPQIAMDAAEHWKLAFDDAGPGADWGWIGAHAGQFAASAYAEGQEWLGYGVLALLSQRPEYRIMVDTVATEMTREWIVFKSKSDDKSQQKRIEQIEARLRELKFRAVMKAANANDGFQGRGQVYIDTGEPDNRDELKMPLGDIKAVKAKYGRGKFIKRLGAIEPMWCYPAAYEASDPLKANWYKPDLWWVMGKEVSRERLLTFVGHEVPDIIKPAYSFGGIATTQMAKPYVDLWLRNRASESDLLNNFSLRVLATTLDVSTADEGSELFQRALTLNTLADSQGLLLTNKDSEEFSIHQTSLGGVPDVTRQSMERMTIPSRMPIVKFFGDQPSGLNACLTGDALIETDRGCIPIREVRPGYKVMTRLGLATVAKVGCTGYTSELIEIRTSETLLLCTANHLIWLPSIGAFVPAVNVQCGNLLLYRGAIEGRSTANQSYGEAGSGGTRELVTTLHPHQNVFCTEKFGAFITDLFQKVNTYITSTETRKIISLTISGFSRLRIMQRCMELMSVFLSTKTYGANANAVIAASGLCCNNPQNANFAVTGARKRTVAQTGARKQNLVRHVFVLCAARFLRRNESLQNIVLEDVRRKARTVQHTVRSITESTQKNGFEQKNKISVGTQCVVSVRRVRVQREMVYDIQVAPGNLPEFFANGICVHNSSEGAIRMWYDDVRAMQDSRNRDVIQRIVELVQIELFDEVIDDIGWDFKALWQLDDAGKAAIQLTRAQVVQTDIASGVIDPEEGRLARAKDEDSPYVGLDLDEREAPGEQLEAEQEEGESEEGGFGGGKLINPRPQTSTSERIARSVEERAGEFGGPATGGFAARDEEKTAFDEWREAQHPRGSAGSAKGGQFVAKGEGGGASGGGSLRKVGDRVWTGKPRPARHEIPKHATGQLGEDIAVAFLKHHGFDDGRPLLEGKTASNNYPLDLVGDHEVFEVKTGVSSSGTARWRITIGQPGKAEAAWLKQADSEEKAAWNRKKVDMAIERKKAALDEVSRQLGRSVRPKTIALIIDPDSGHVDIHVIDGFHANVGWNSPIAEKSYVGSYQYERAAA